MENKKVVITYGTFDLLHIGHINIFKRAKNFGNYLVVGVSTDEFNKQKNKNSHEDQETRKKNILETGLVDEVFFEDNWDQKVDDIKKYKADVFVMGGDWKGKFDHLMKYTKVVYLDRTEGISSTELREKLND